MCGLCAESVRKVCGIDSAHINYYIKKYILHLALKHVECALHVFA